MGCPLTFMKMLLILYDFSKEPIQGLLHVMVALAGFDAQAIAPRRAAHALEVCTFHFPVYERNYALTSCSRLSAWGVVYLHKLFSPRPRIAPINIDSCFVRALLAEACHLGIEDSTTT